ncbi:RNA polymerase sigma factor [Sphingomonas oryzagri]
MMQPDNTMPQEMRRLDAAFRTERPRLLRYLNHLAGRDAAPDLVQEIFVRAAATPRLAEIDSLSAYLTRVARNVAFERARTGKRKEAMTCVFGEQHDPGAPAEQAWCIEVVDILRLYRKALRAMPRKTRRVFLLRRRHLTYREIGEVLGISVPTVEYHVMRAMAVCHNRITAVR